jgi:hypothetical protein
MTKIIQVDAVKIFKTRDSATSLLRKLGIQSRDYNFFIEKMTDGRFACQIARAQMHLESLKNPAPKPVIESGKAGRRAANPVVKSTKTAKGVSAVARELILAGRTNQEVWAVIKEAFNLDDSKKHYPTWYRCEMKRKGQLPANA